MARRGDRDLAKARDKVAAGLRTARSDNYNRGFLDGAQTGFTAGYDNGYSDGSSGKAHRSSRATHSDQR